MGEPDYSWQEVVAFANGDGGPKRQDATAPLLKPEPRYTIKELLDMSYIEGVTTKHSGQPARITSGKGRSK